MHAPQLSAQPPTELVSLKLETEVTALVLFKPSCRRAMLCWTGSVCFRCTLGAHGEDLTLSGP